MSEKSPLLGKISAACKSAAKSKFKVWPSAYASGWGVPAKVRSMSSSEKSKVVSAKKSAASSGKYKRSSKSNVKGARKKGATLRDWFEKENWINVETGEPCGK